MRDARGGGSAAPASITCPLPALGSASPAQHPSPAPRSVTQQVKGRGTRRPEPSRPPARGTYCCRGCRSRRAAAGRGGSVAPCSALSSASSRLASHNKGGEGGRRGAAGPGGGLAGRRGHTAACPAAPCLFCQGHPRKEVLAGNGSASRLPPLPRRGGAEPSVPRTTQPRQPPAVPGDGEVGTVAAWALGCGGPQTAPVALGGKGAPGCATATATAPSLTSFSSLSYALGMPRQCPYPEKPHQVLAVDAKHADPSRCHSPGGASTRGAPRAPYKGLGSGAGRG